MPTLNRAVLSALLAGLAAFIVFMVVDGGFSGTAVAVGLVAALAAGGTRWLVMRRSVS
ncbi:MAG: hypothetical protein AAFY28_07305 [Actinomycetota bacterium]